MVRVPGVLLIGLLLVAELALPLGADSTSPPPTGLREPILREAWPAWRGGPAEGRVDRPLPTTWSPHEGIRWKTAIPGRGHSSPTVFGPTIYVTTADVTTSGLGVDATLRFATLGLLVLVAVLAVELVAVRCHPDRQPTPRDFAVATGITLAVLALTVIGCSGDALWRKRLPGHYFASPVASPDAVYFTNSDGVTTVLAAEPGFRVIATNDLREETMASMAAADGETYIRSINHLYAIAPSATAAPDPGAA